MQCDRIWRNARLATLAARAGVPKPGVYVTPAEQPNAFATGRNPEHAAIAVTAGIQRSSSGSSRIIAKRLSLRYSSINRVSGCFRATSSVR